MARLKRRLSTKFFISVFLTLVVAVPLVYAEVDAPTGFDDQTNGFSSQLKFETDRDQFEEREDILKGLGPVYNAQACAECHQNPISGSGTQFSELRAGRTVAGVFTEHAGGSLINDRAIDARIQEEVFDSDDTRTFRISLNVLGDGFVEAIPDAEFTRIQTDQPAGMKGTIISVPVLEASLNGSVFTRIARFGWKDQHASLVSFAADAYLNEMGITSPLFPNENTSNGNSVAAFDIKSDPEDLPTTEHPFGKDVESFARFMRSTKAPDRSPAAQDPNDPSYADIQAGAEFFARISVGGIGCADCHTDTITTALAGTSFNGGMFIVPNALGDKIIHPYSDFMLHDVGTGDGIVQNGGPETRNKIRTPPLWGLRTRTRLMHDGLTLTRKDAIARHAGQAAGVITSYNGLSNGQKAKLLAFLGSL